MSVRSFALSALGTATLATWLALPHASPSGALLATLLALPASLAAVACWRIARVVVDHKVQRSRADGLARVGFSAVVTGVVLLSGLYLSNVLLVDPPSSGTTLAAYAVTVAAGALTAWAARRVARRSEPARRIGARVLVASSSLVIGVGAATIDAGFLPAQYEGFHRALGAVAFGSIAGFCVLGLEVLEGSRARVRAWAGLLATASLLGLVPLVGADAASLGLQARAVVGDRTVHRRLLLAARSLADRDGDGFSSILAGGDCDDADPKAYPLSRVGRDCFGFVGVRSASSEPATPSSSPGSLAPHDVVPVEGPPKPDAILLVTIDAFRCGFDTHGRAELRHACPNLTRLAGRGPARLIGHTVSPTTLLGVSAIHHVPASEGSLLAAALGKRGYEGRVVATHPRILESPHIREPFVEIDESLVPAARRPGGVTGEAVTDLLLARLRAVRPAQRLFLWGHYYDAHAPYVRVEGSPWSPSALGGYIEEVRRTDAAVGRLIDALEGELRGLDVALFVTADHGEEFGEHGGSMHGAALYEESVGVPFLAWRAKAPMPADLPASVSEVGPYLLAAADGLPFQSSGEAYLHVRGYLDDQIGLVRYPWKIIIHRRLAFTELFDLERDPGERVDLSRDRPDVLRELGRRAMELHAQHE